MAGPHPQSSWVIGSRVELNSEPFQKKFPDPVDAAGPEITFQETALERGLYLEWTWKSGNLPSA